MLIYILFRLSQHSEAVTHFGTGQGKTFNISHLTGRGSFER